MLISNSMQTWWRSKKFIFLFLLALLLSLLFFLRSYVTGVAESRHFFTIARDISWYPLDLLGKEKNMQGFTGELVLEIGKKEKWHFGFIDVGPYSLIEGLHRHLYDAVITSIVPTLIQEEAYLFSESIYPLGPVLIVDAFSPIRSLNEMQGKIVQVGPGTLQVFNTTNHPTILFSAVDSDSQMLEDLLRGRADGVIMDAFKAYSYVQGAYVGKLKVATAPLTDRGLRLMMLISPRNRVFIEQFNEGLTALKADGTYDKLIGKWGLFLPSEEIANRVKK